MAQLQIAYLPRRGTEERWRRLCQEVAELRPEQFAAACQQAGITQVQVQLLHLLHSELLLVYVQMQEPQQTHEALEIGAYLKMGRPPAAAGPTEYGRAHWIVRRTLNGLT